MTEETSEKAPMQQNLNTDLCRFISKFEAGDFNLLDGKSLLEFTRWINVEIHKLNLNLMQATVAGNKSQQYRECVNNLMMRLLTLQEACYNLEEQLNTDRMSEE